mgnify:CR=1 FL=1
MSSITPQILLRAYAAGIFPMAESAEDNALYWVEPEERGVIPLDGLKVSHSLRKAVRHISDAPNELLDERQIATRDAAYTVAYRVLAFVGVAAFFLHILLPFESDTDDLFAGRGSLILAFAMAAAALPAMVLAWNLPSEPEA